MIVAAAAGFLYYEDMDRSPRRILTCEALLLCLTVCEALGVIAINWVLKLADDANMNAAMRQCLEVVFSKIVVIFLYYLVISRLMKKREIPHSGTHDFIYVVMLVYSLINMLVAIEIFRDGDISYLCVINMVCIVLIDLYLLHFINVEDEKNYYAGQLKMLEQQAGTQYEYYLALVKKCDRSVQILHDVKKHIKMIHELYESGQEKTADEYVNEISDMLNQLVPVNYTGNPILNILLTEKELVMKERGISLDMEIDPVNLEFLDPMDVTTIFGNLLDNAVEAVQKAEGEKKIFIKLAAYHKMVAVRIENTCNPVTWKNGLPVSAKDKDGGIGLLNVRRSIEKYDGNLQIREEKGKFIAELFLNA